MESQPELWVILQDKEDDYVWDEIHSEFHFNPQSKVNGLPTFKFKVPVDAYDISNSPLYRDDETTNNLVRSIFIECMEDDDFMYALDWQHTCFRYNPRINATFEYPVFIADERFEHGGYNVYFPEFYPNGEFNFFIAKDFRWGYLTHPWLEKAWVFGDKLMRAITEHSDRVGFVPCAV